MNDAEERQYKTRVKSAHFNEDGIATVIPSSKNYKYDPGSEHSRKDAVDEFHSKRGTYIAAVVVGTIVFVMGCILIWVGSHYDLQDFFVLGPLVLCIGIGLAVGGTVFLCLSFRKSKKANTRVASSNYPARLVDTPSTVLSDHSFVTTGDVTMDMAGLMSRPTSGYLYGSQANLIDEEREESFVVVETPKPEELYSAHATPKKPKTVRTSTPSGECREDRVCTPEGEMFAVSLPNQALRSQADGSSDCDSIGDKCDNIDDDDFSPDVPKAATYIEPGDNSDSAITAL